MADEQAAKVELADVKDELAGNSAQRSAGEPPAKAGKPERKSIREDIADARAAAKAKADAEEEKASKAAEPKEEAREKPVDKEAAPDTESKLNGKEPPQGEKPAVEKQTATPVPDSWPKEVRAEWEKIPPAAQQQILKREADSKKGVEELKSRYHEIDETVAPYNAMIKQSGRSPGQVIKAMFDWNMALAGPKKLDAFRALAQNFGIDIAAFAPPAADGSQGRATAAPDGLQTVLEPLQTDLRTTQAQLAELQQSERARTERVVQQTLADFAKDHPHFERVRMDMKKLVDMDMMNSQRGLQPEYLTPAGQIDLEKAYQTACRMNGEIWNEVQAAERDKLLEEERKKQQAEASRKALEAKKAKEAAGSVKSGSPGANSGGSAQSAPRGESIRDSIKRSLATVKGK